MVLVKREELHRKSVKDAVYLGTSGGLMVKTLCFHCKQVWVWFLVRELRSHILRCNQKKKFFLKSYFFNIHIYWMPIYVSHSVKYWGCWKLKRSMWRRKWQPTPVFLPGESQGQRSLVGCCSLSYPKDYGIHSTLSTPCFVGEGGEIQ